MNSMREKDRLDGMRWKNAGAAGRNAARPAPDGRENQKV